MQKIRLYFILNELEVYTKLMSGMLKSEKTAYRKLWKIDDSYDDYWYFRKYYKTELEHFKRYQYLDFHTYLHDDILTKVDRVSMAVSLECRVPLLSKEIIEYSFSLKDNVRIHNNELKGAMKEAFTGFLPDLIIRCGKKGFSIPQKWNVAGIGHETKQEKILRKYFKQVIEL